MKNLIICICIIGLGLYSCGDDRKGSEDESTGTATAGGGGSATAGGGTGNTGGGVSGGTAGTSGTGGSQSRNYKVFFECKTSEDRKDFKPTDNCQMFDNGGYLFDNQNKAYDIEYNDAPSGLKFDRNTKKIVLSEKKLLGSYTENAGSYNIAYNYKGCVGTFNLKFSAGNSSYFKVEMERKIDPKKSKDCSRGNSSHVSYFGEYNGIIGEKSKCSPNDHEESGRCVPNKASCEPTGKSNGVGQKIWVGEKWGPCKLVSCLKDFHLETGKCISNKIRCNGKRDDGSSFTGEKIWDGKKWGNSG